MCGSSSGRQRALRLRARGAIVKTKQLLKVVRKIMKTKQTQRADDADVRRGFDDKLDLDMLAGYRQNVEEVWIHTVDKQWIIFLGFFQILLKQLS